MSSLLKVAVDVHYDEAAQVAYGAALVFADWADRQPLALQGVRHQGLQPYVSGAFFRRELPVLLPLLARVREQFEVRLVVVDGHVDLGVQRPGLGRHLHRALERRLTVVGVAKNPFRGAPGQPVYRGASTKPLWVSSTGDGDLAAQAVVAMHGDHRIPTLLKLVDQHAREAQ